MSLYDTRGRNGTLCMGLLSSMFNNLDAIPKISGGSKGGGGGCCFFCLSVGLYEKIPVKEFVDPPLKIERFSELFM